MKLIMTFISLLFLSLTALAEEMKTRINSIDQGKNGEPHLIKLTNARVAFVPSEEKSLLTDLRYYKNKRELLQIVLDEKYNIVALTPLKEFGAKEDEIFDPEPQEEEEKEVATYYPTVLPDLKTAKKVFKKMRRDYQNESQCYNRAHIWALEEFNRSKLKSMKLFMFFTNRYIRDYRYEWWFHVSTMVVVPEGEGLRYKVLDRRYSKGPLNIKSWTDDFIKSKRACPEAKKYKDYSQNQEKEHCYLMPVSMYFWQPRDIEARDRSGQVKKSFIKWETDHAYWEAF